MSSEQAPITDSSDGGLKFYPLHVVSVNNETADASSIVLRVEAELDSLFEYQSGQFLTFQIPWEDFFIRRSYSLCSSPAASEPMTIAVKRVEEGRGSNWLNDAVKPGMEIMACPPSGRFTMRAGLSNPLLMFAGGSGITPVISIIKTALITGDRLVSLFYANRDQQSIIFEREISRLEQQYPQRFTCHHHLDSDSGYLNSDQVKHFIDSRWDADFYVCGPAAFMDMVEDTLYENNTNASQIFIERFVSPIDLDRQEQVSTEDTASETATQIKLKITVDGIDFDIPYQSGKTILDCVLEHPELEDVPYSCQQGHCGSCMSILREGKVRMLENHVLSKRDLEQGYVLACQSIPESDKVWIDFDD